MNPEDMNDEERYKYEESQHFCRHCFKRAFLIPLITNNDVYMLCEECIDKIMNGELEEMDITTYEWTLEQILKKDKELSEKWYSRVYGGVR